MSIYQNIRSIFEASYNNPRAFEIEIGEIIYPIYFSGVKMGFRMRFKIYNNLKVSQKAISLVQCLSNREIQANPKKKDCQDMAEWEIFLSKATPINDKISTDIYLLRFVLRYLAGLLFDLLIVILIG